MSVTPVSEKTVSMTAKDQQGPTPKNEFKKPVNQRWVGGHVQIHLFLKGMEQLRLSVCLLDTSV